MLGTKLLGAIEGIWGTGPWKKREDGGGDPPWEKKEKWENMGEGTLGEKENCQWQELVRIWLI